MTAGRLDMHAMYRREAPAAVWPVWNVWRLLPSAAAIWAGSYPDMGMEFAQPWLDPDVPDARVAADGPRLYRAHVAFWPLAYFRQAATGGALLPSSAARSPSSRGRCRGSRRRTRG